MNSTQAKRYFRELCGQYNPTQTAPEKRFTLTNTELLGELEVPVFITRDHIATYPQIRISPFITDIIESKYREYTKSMGDSSKGEFSDIEYTRSRTDTNIRQARFQLDIFTKDSTQLTKIRDALYSRWDDFFNPEFAEFGPDTDNWVQNNGVWVNNGYNTSIKIFRIFDSTKILKKCSSLSDVTTTIGSWFLDDTGLYVNPLTEIKNLTYMEAINGEVFYDGSTASDKGFRKNFKIITSRETSDEDQTISRWIMEVLIKFKDSKQKNIGRGFSVVNINDTETK